ncbi:MAG TPA: GNAT family N-acetyltransferase [Steroidobacteraceae bacterium]|nr:GNAT family N-acetyltransferase [Steroidobacteraceae bacterium]
MSGLTIRPATLADAWAIAGIYNHYIRHTVVTFEEDTLSTQAMEQRIAAVRVASLPWLVAESRDALIGYAYGGRFKERSAYRYCVETAVYLAHGREGQGIGTRLYTDLLDTLRQQGIRTAVGIIALPNAPSVTLHEKLGFLHTGTLQSVGFKQDRWVDVGYWQKLLP